MFGRKTRVQQRQEVLDLATRSWGQQVQVARLREPEVVFRVRGRSLSGDGVEDVANKPKRNTLLTVLRTLFILVFGIFLITIAVIVAILLDGADGCAPDGCLDLPDAPKRHRITVYGEDEHCEAVPFGHRMRSLTPNTLWLVWSDSRVGIALAEKEGYAHFRWTSTNVLHPQLTKRRPRLTWSWPDGSSARVRFTRAERRRARKQAR